MKYINFPEKFITGVASSGFDIEGGDSLSSMYQWALRNNPGSARMKGIDHWNMFENDIRMIKELKIKSYIMSIEWSRIEPNKGEFSKKNIDHYKEIIKTLKKEGINPLISLSHVSTPLWFIETGGWENPHSPLSFSSYTEYAVSQLGSDASEWITLFEPNKTVAGSMITGEFPPGKKSLASYIKSASNMISAHRESYTRIHAIRKDLGKKDTSAGAVFSSMIFHAEESFLKRLKLSAFDHLFNELFFTGFAEGRKIFPAGAPLRATKPCTALDFIGISHSGSIGLPGEKFFPEKIIHADIESYVGGLFTTASRYNLRYKKPVYLIFSPGKSVPDESLRIQTHSHLNEASRLIRNNIEISRFYYNPLFNTTGSKNGLLDVSEKNLKRKINNTGLFWSEISESGGISQSIVNKYL